MGSKRERQAANREKKRVSRPPRSKAGLKSGVYRIFGIPTVLLEFEVALNRAQHAAPLQEELRRRYKIWGASCATAREVMIGDALKRAPTEERSGPPPFEAQGKQKADPTSAGNKRGK